MGLLFGVLTQKAGIHALFGFFIAGVVAGEAKSLSEQTRGVISQMVHSLFVPLFFANIGLKIDFAAHFELPLVLLISAIGIAGRYLGAWLGVTWARAPRINRDLIAIAHTPSGMMEIVVALLALEAGLLTQPVFVAIVFSAVLSSVLAGPWMARSLARRASVSPARFLAPGAVVPELAASVRDEAIRELAALVASEAGTIEMELVAERAIAREQEFGTALGSGVAIPHARIDGLKNPILAFGRSRQGMEWDSPDGAPVHNVFLLATPSGTEDIHVQILAAIASSLSHPSNRQLVHDAEGREGLATVLETLLTAGTLRAKGGGNAKPRQAVAKGTGQMNGDR
ncbi:MAG: hypothetical protein FJ224_10720 [Lentisphaerae bacterium]|nr:hypothetical protein [Lentisphaerota bacterium]